jgi:hypothetical protein
MVEKFLNPRTNRYVKKGTAKWRELVREGVLKEERPKIKPITTEDESSEGEESDTPTPPPIKKELAKTSVAVVRKNKSKFKDLNQKESDKLLRKLLYKKLCPPSKSHKVKLKRQKAKAKKKKKKKQSRYYSSSSSSSSSSENSSSESDSEEESES